MSATIAALDLTKLRVGKSRVFIGTFATTSGLTELGVCEGGVIARPASQFSTLKLPEISGDVPLRVDHIGDTIEVDLPIIIGNADLWGDVSPLGQASGGVTKSREVTYTSMLIIPDSELSAAGSIGYATTTWTPAAPEHALFIHKGYFEHIPREFEHNQDGHKKVTTAKFIGVLDDTQPDKYKLWFQNAAAAITAGVTIAI